MATQVVELSGDEANLLRALDKVIQKEREHERALGRMGDAGDQAGFQLEDAMARIQKANDDAIKQTIKQLNQLGPEGKRAASLLQEGFKEVGRKGFDGPEALLKKLKSLDPATADVVESVSAKFEELSNKIKADLASADAATKFDDSIRELEKINPTAAAAAKKVREQMDLADADVKFDNIIAELEKVDPAAAAQAKKLRGHMKTAADEGAVSWKSFATSAVAQIGAVAGTYLGVQEAIALVNDYLKEQEQLLQNALSKQNELAKAQQEAAKNLAGYKAIERDELLQKAVPELVRSTGVGGAEITDAISNAASAGATPDQAKAAAEAAARLNRLTPDKVAPNAGGIVSVMAQTGLQDPRQAAALLATAGPISKVDEAAAVAATLPLALGTAATVPNQRPEDAARQIAALYGVASNKGVDETGKSTATFLVDFNNRMNDLFSNMADKQVDARSKIELIDRKIEKGTDTEANRRDREQLLQFLKESDGMRDPGTIFGRLEAIQQSPGLQRQFLGEAGKFGEQQFQVTLKELINSQSDASKQLQTMAESIRADVQYFESTVTDNANATPQLRGSNFVAGGEASRGALDITNTEGARLAALRARVATDLSVTRQSGVSGFLDAQVGEMGIKKGSLAGSTFAEESIDALASIRTRIGSLQDGGVTPDEKAKIDLLSKTIADIQQLLLEDVSRGDVSRESATSAIGMARNSQELFAREGATGEAKFYANLAKQIADALQRQNDLMEENNNLLADTAANTAPGPAPTPDYDSVTRGAAAQEDAR